LTCRLPTAGADIIAPRRGGDAATPSPSVTPLTALDRETSPSNCAAPGPTSGPLLPGWISEFQNGTITWLNDGKGNFSETVTKN
jgi:hypothetical protein